MLTPSTCASRAWNSFSSLPKAAISVGQTKVKSFGQKNTTFHLPGKLSWRDGLEGGVQVVGDHAGEGEIGKTLTNA